MSYFGAFMTFIMGLVIDVITSIIPGILTIIISYVFTAIGLYSIAHRRGLTHPWLAWIPIGNNFILGEITDDYKMQKTGKGSSLRWWILISSVLASVYFFIACIKFTNLKSTVAACKYPSDVLDLPDFSILEACIAISIWMVIALIATVVLAVFMFVALYSLYKSCTDKYKLMLILSIFVSILMPFFIFAIRKKDRNLEIVQTQTDRRTEFENG